jgi:DNA replication protein DnaC
MVAMPNAFVKGGQMAEWSLAEIYRQQILNPRRLTDDELSIVLEASANVEHKNSCPKCSGSASNTLWPCTRDPAYGAKTKRLGAGLPVNTVRGFSNFNERPGTEEGVRLATRFAEEPVGWLLMIGKRGVGKTHLAQAIAERLLAANQSVFFSQVGGMLGLWRSWFDHPTLLWQPSYNRAREFPFVILDDLGAERTTEWSQDVLLQFLDYRYDNRLPTVITTNVDLKDFPARYTGGTGQRIGDRTYDTGTRLVQIAELTCDSYRTEQRW